METDWIARPVLLAAMNARPQDFAPWFRIYMRRWDELGFAPSPKWRKHPTRLNRLCRMASRVQPTFPSGG
jgi:hypothetical protein